MTDFGSDADSGDEIDHDADDPGAKFCFVLANSTEPCDADQAAEAVSEILGPEFIAEVDDGGVVGVTCGSETIGFLALMPAPIPGGEAEDNAAGNFFWPNGRDESAAHRSHVIVTVAGGSDPGSPVEAALMLSKLSLVALRLYDGIGVYWGSARVCNSRAFFEASCEGMSEDQLPVPVWLRFQFVRDDDGTKGLYTLGMPQFGLMDVEVERFDGDPEDVFGIVCGMAHYLLQSGPVIADGNTVGGTPEEQIIVRHLPSRVDPGRTVYKILFGG
jgi:hypothetical protein